MCKVKWVRSNDPGPSQLCPFYIVSYDLGDLSRLTHHEISRKRGGIGRNRRYSGEAGDMFSRSQYSETY